MSIEVVLQQCIDDCLRNNMMTNAMFLAERLVAASPTDANNFMLANICYRQGNIAQTHAILRLVQHRAPDTLSFKSMQLLAICCYELGEYNEAEQLLSQCLETMADAPLHLHHHHSTTERISKCSRATVHYLAGLVSRKLNQRIKAIDHFQQALLLYPYMWVAYEQLCNLGQLDIDPAVFFGSLEHNQSVEFAMPLPPLRAGGPGQDSTMMSSIGVGSYNTRSSSTTAGSDFQSISTKSSESSGMMLASNSHATVHQAPRKQQHKSHFTSAALHGSSSSMSSSMGATRTPAGMGMGALNFDMTPQPQLFPGQTPMSGAPSHTIHNNSLVTPVVPVKRNLKVVNSPIPMQMFNTPGPQHQFEPQNLQFTPLTTPSPQVASKAGRLPEVRKKIAPNQFQDKRNDTHDGSVPFNEQMLMFESKQQHTAQHQQLQQQKTNEDVDMEKKRRNEGTTTSTATTTTTKHVQIGGVEEIWIDTNIQDSDSVTDPLTLSDISDVPSTTAGHTELLSLLHTIAQAYQLLCKFSCRAAIECFGALPYEQYNTGWVMTLIGKAYFEMVDYNEANRVFEQVRELEPYRLEGVEIYSTVLWHLKKEVEMSYLANQLTSFDRLSAQAWCVVGNCFSLQKDHESALKSFRRAVQLDPKFTYAFTLCGHEYFSTDDLENAQDCYRSAIRIDPRHYNAWYGLGLIHFRQEKYDAAEYHFRKALSINPTSSVLYCYVGMTLQSNKRYPEALIELQQAIDISPRNTLAKFKKATILYALEMYGEALQELEEFKEIAPKEISLYILIGKVHKKLGNLDQAMESLTIALDMGPENSTYVRSIIDKLYVEDDVEDVSLII
ncbi:hypothetical protein SAMD00019534_026090 [Acytostelium subglobosum LB1]|uniref:hypothetical protein n=1 Tax=Acytostelium subglobosum LB1 TaxID=1410327 RepID=UPI000645084A|nr:hypothetical protein SAMD00019534_026090 [Acytostelium subglobosum LB1]GAM19434.1 hypothetical protein SAMD00019534_026090 [Acytostelium subglobosum LB1]|eukprot:XP_012757361.1 hypothetical protein SAMD00019534_026090 [Acytostelium subglobosum LB1]